MKSNLVNLSDKNLAVFNDKLGIQSFGINNLYPIETENIIDKSTTGKACIGIINKFIRGGGFNLPSELNNVVIGKSGIMNLTLNKLLRRIAHDVSYHNGIYLHLNYNLNYKISSISILPFTNTRLGNIDSYGNIDKIYYSEKFSKKTNVKKEDLISFDVYNPDPSVIKAQIMNAGGINNYNGQVFYYNFDEYNIYPLSNIDVVKLDAETEHLIQVYKNNDLAKGFFAKYMVKVPQLENDSDFRELQENLKQFSGAENNSSFMVIEDEFINDPNTTSFNLERIELNVDSKIWEHYETSLAENIRKSVGNIPQVLISYVEGKLGNTSGDSLDNSFGFMNHQTEDYRLNIEEIMYELLSNFKDERFNNPEYLKIKKLGNGSNI